jgi:hypothetical protein
MPESERAPALYYGARAVEKLREDLMKSIYLKLQEELLKTIERCARALGISRAEYIRREIERINRGGYCLRRAFIR